MFKHILAPTDGSPLSRNANRIAVDLARLANARLTFVHCTVPFEVFIHDPLTPVGRDLYEALVENAAQEYLEVGHAMARESGVHATGKAVPAEQTWQGILDTARTLGCDLVVMASHGRHGAAALLPGSETREVLAHSTLPVMVCR